MSTFKTMAAQQVKAPYTFIPADGTVVLSPLYGHGASPDLSRPLPQGLTGSITVDWRAETPILIGAAGDQNRFVTMGGRPVLPGSALRGMLRSVLESAAFARLNYLEDERYFALRDFKDTTLQKGVKEAVTAELGAKTPRMLAVSSDPSLAKAGWLSINVKTGEGALQETRWIKMLVTDLAQHLRISGSQWLRDPWHLKHQALIRANLCHDSTVPTLVPLNGLAGPQERGYIVHAGRDPSNTPNKASEAVFVDAPDLQALRQTATSNSTKPAEGFHRLHPLQVTRFLTVQPQQNTEGSERENHDHWSLWTHYKQWADADGWVTVPVFVIGPWADLSHPPRKGRAFLSLTRFVRFPHTYSVADVAARTQSDPDRNKLDLVQALFGWTAPDRDDQDGQAHTRRVDTDRAWRSRVAIGIAPEVTGRHELPEQTEPFVTMAPRPSFYPFYLRSKKPNPSAPVDWSHEDAILAGRKRYPARNRGQVPPLEAAERGLANNTVSLLKATPQAPLIFRGEIRFRNLLPEELGALLWAIGFGHDGIGETDGRSPTCHMLGRGKAFGFGQLRPVVTGLSFRRSMDSGTTAAWTPATRNTCAGWLTAFAAYILTQRGTPCATPADALAHYHALRPIRLLRNTGNATAGEAVRDQLGWPKGDKKNQDSSPIIEGYKKVREDAKRQYTVLPDYEPEAGA